MEGTTRSMSPYKGMKMAHMVKQRLAPVPQGAISPSYVPLDADESRRNEAIAANMRQTAHVTNNTRMRVVLPWDGNGSHRQEQAQAARQAEWRKQSAMPWGSNFMHTPTDRERLNNPAQYAAVRQRQLTIPNTYGQFYAFMHALSAAFGTLQQ